MQPLIAILILIAAFFLAKQSDKNIRVKLKNNPENRGFAWVFFQAWLGILISPLTAVVYLYTYITSDIPLYFLGLMLIIAAVYFVLSYLLLMRLSRFAFTALTVLSFFPILWIINYAYGQPRWTIMREYEENFDSNSLAISNSKQ